MTSALPEVLEKLEPCPFCGREATVENPEEGCYAIGCDDCCFSVMAGNVGIGWYATRAEAITAWNTRPALLRDAGDGWLPIESAPVSGEWVLLWWRTCRKPSVGHYVCDESGSGWRCEGDQCVPVNQKDCTHWRPLPQPPAMHAPGGAGGGS